MLQLLLGLTPSTRLQQPFQPLVSPSRWTTSWDPVSCTRQMKEWEGPPAHLHWNAILSVKALCGRMPRVFSHLFFLHLLWDHMEFPSLCVCPLWIVGVGIGV